MRPFQSPKLLPIVFTLLALVSSALSSYSPQLEILYWPVANSEPSVLAHVIYDPASLKADLIDYSPPTDPSQGLTRIGIYIATPTNPKQWVGMLASSSALRGDDSQRPTLRLHISPANEVYHVSLGSATTSTSLSSSDSLNIELVTDELGPTPHLNRPVVVGPDGKNPEEEPEKTLFQKYWWVLLIVTFLAMSGGGEQQ
ncbi:uncharacterized protein BDV17DRAFT_247261 [Aspergillus undulatus]|uniref:uncharacterized protein n=1 Tax=Aspergillus undulatus TaxID=1810928 RepID=UPI003CCCDF91